MSKYKEYFNKMMEENRQLFDDFGQIHLKYMQEPKTYQKEFNSIGEQVLEVVRKYENMLCGKTESGSYAKYSANLADKFHEIIKINFPRIDSVGIIWD